MVYNDLIIKNIQDNITNNITICKTMDIKTNVRHFYLYATVFKCRKMFEEVPFCLVFNDLTIRLHHTQIEYCLTGIGKYLTQLFETNEFLSLAVLAK